MPELRERTLPGLHTHLFERLRDIPKTTQILDVGCGTGAWLQRLANAGFVNLHGIDRDVTQFAASGATVNRADLDADDLGLGAKKFGLITAIELIEHLECPGRLLFHVSAHLAQNGLFLVTTPNVHSVVARLRFLVKGKLQQFDEKGDPTHVSPVYIQCLERALPRHELRLCEQWTFPPDAGGLASRPFTRVLAAVAGLVLPDQLPGDILCLKISRRERQE